MEVRLVVGQKPSGWRATYPLDERACVRQRGPLPLLLPPEEVSKRRPAITA
jgi:hypothetical protein